MRIEASWVSRYETQQVCKALGDAGFQALFVGGCVRNALLNRDVSDIDIATDARPEDTIACAEAAGLRAVPTGIDHGTITVVSGGIPHEVTTFRADVDTDGRHAVVQFSQDIAEDAARRDFTMNALYASADGTVIDPLGGMVDLHTRRVRFIGDAEKRIREDYLRSLRFFRFFAWYGDPAEGLDADGLAAIAANLEGLAGLSRERVGSEVLKLLSAQDPAQAVAGMHHSGALGAVLPGADHAPLATYVHLEQGLELTVDPIARLAAIGGSDVADRLRLSRMQSKTLDILRAEVGDMKSAQHLGYVHGAETALRIMALRAALLEQPLTGAEQAETARGAAAIFPVSAGDLMPEFTGQALGDKLAELKARWIASGFALRKQDLLR